MVPPGAAPIKSNVTIVCVGVICVDALNNAVGAVLAIGVMVNGNPFPQLLTGVTVIVPVPVPTVTVIEPVVLVPVQPKPETVHV